MIDLNFVTFNQGPRDVIDLKFLIFHQGPRDTDNHKNQVNKRYHRFYTTVIFRTVGSGGALRVQRGSPEL